MINESKYNASRSAFAIFAFLSFLIAQLRADLTVFDARVLSLVNNCSLIVRIMRFQIE